MVDSQEAIYSPMHPLCSHVDHFAFRPSEGPEHTLLHIDINLLNTPIHLVLVNLFHCAGSFEDDGQTFISFIDHLSPSSTD